MLSDNEIAEVFEISRLTSKKILEIYNTDFEIEIKEDDSPVTLADKIASDYIIEELSNKFPDWPAISEEASIPNYEERNQYKTYWLIDPVDGTKEFVKKTGEFTVNIALIHLNKPVASVIYHPTRDIGYFAIESKGAFKQINDQKTQIFSKNSGSSRIKVAGSRSHSSKKFNEFIQSISRNYENIDILRLGSSYKFCLLAEGVIDVYPRFGPTNEWDTAAGHVICTEAGANIYQLGKEEILMYNKKSLKNPHFIASTNDQIREWNEELKKLIQ